MLHEDVSQASLSLSLSLPPKPHFAKSGKNLLKKYPKSVQISEGQIHEKKGDRVVSKNVDDLCNDH